MTLLIAMKEGELMDMDAFLSTAVSITIVTGFLWGILHYVIKRKWALLWLRMQICRHLYRGWINPSAK